MHVKLVIIFGFLQCVMWCIFVHNGKENLWVIQLHIFSSRHKNSCDNESGALRDTKECLNLICATRKRTFYLAQINLNKFLAPYVSQSYRSLFSPPIQNVFHYCNPTTVSNEIKYSSRAQKALEVKHKTLVKPQRASFCQPKSCRSRSVEFQAAPNDPPDGNLTRIGVVIIASIRAQDEVYENRSGNPFSRKIFLSCNFCDRKIKSRCIGGCETGFFFCGGVNGIKMFLLWWHLKPRVDAIWTIVLVMVSA